VFGILCLRQGFVSTERNEAVQLGMQSFGAREYGSCDFERRNLFATNTPSKIGGGEKARIVAHL
jgi:hypothetical protein